MLTGTRMHVRGSTIENGLVRVHDGGTLRVTGITVLEHGEFELLGGTVVFRIGQTYDGVDDGGDINAVLAPLGGVLSVGNTVGVEGNLTPFSPIVIDGGELWAETFTNLTMVELRKGVLGMTEADLDVGPGGMLGDTVALTRGQHLRIGMTVNIAGDGRVELDGGRLGAGLLSNAGVMTGDGRVDGPLANLAGGSLRADLGDSLLFAGGGSTNSGEMRLLGGAVEFDQGLTNLAGGQINGRGTLIVEGGLTNEGHVRFSGGFADVFGDVNNTAGALVRVDGGGVATFYNDVVNEGTFQTSSTSETVFLGMVTGSGDFASGGTVVFEDVFSPGSSPGEVLVDGDVVLGDGARLVLELGGVEQGVSFDHVSVSDSLEAGGVLEVALIDGFTPGLGSRFEVLSFGSVSGGFDSVILPVLGHGLSFDDSGLLTDGAMVVVPEPGVGVAFLVCGGLMVRRRRR